MNVEPDDTDDDPPCWCGVEHPYVSDDLPDRCGGNGYLECRCGGDQCVCHWHGGIDCDGCEDCSSEDGEYDWSEA